MKRTGARLRGLAPPWFVLVLLTAPTLSGCMVKQDHVELGPLYYKRPLPEERGTETAVLWPFFQSYRSETVNQIALRPLLNIRHEKTDTEQGHIREVQALWPLFLFRKTDGPKQLRVRFYPFFRHVEYEHADGILEEDTAFFPFLFRGQGGTEKDYFGFFPFGGHIRGLFGKEDIRFFLFPLYADTQEGEHRSWHFLFPFFQYSQGGDKSSFRIWPLIGSKQKTGHYKQRFLLWPLFVHKQEKLSSEHPTESWFFLPFYGRQQTPFGRIRYFLFPFFSYQRNERPGNRFREWDSPWPLVSMARGDRVRKTYLLPLWGKLEQPGYQKLFAAYPLYHRYIHQRRASTITRTYLLPLYWSTCEVDKEGTLLGKRTKLWPFLQMSEARGQGTHLSLLSPLWFRDPKGFERNYGPFWTLFEWHREDNQQKEWRFLWLHGYNPSPGGDP